MADALKSLPVASSAAACAKPKAASSILEGIEDNPSDSVRSLIFLPISLSGFNPKTSDLKLVPRTLPGTANPNIPASVPVRLGI